jgi:hypothetical protein
MTVHIRRREFIVALGGGAAMWLLGAPVQQSVVYAAGPYDGEWTGFAKGTSDGRCKPADVTLTVLGKVVTGRARFETDISNIYGTVREDGAFGATIGFQPLAGKFAQDEVEGSFSNAGCTWRMLLKRAR